MKLLVALATTTLLAGCSTPQPSGGHTGTTRITASGKPGTMLTGHYVQAGQRIAVSQAVPWTLEVPQLSSLELRAASPGSQVVIDLDYDSSKTRSHIQKSLNGDGPGIKVQVNEGLIVKSW